MGWITAIVGFKCNQLIPNVCVNSTNFRHTAVMNFQLCLHFFFARCLFICLGGFEMKLIMHNLCGTRHHSCTYEWEIVCLPALNLRKTMGFWLKTVCVHVYEAGDIIYTGLNDGISNFKCLHSDTLSSVCIIWSHSNSIKRKVHFDFNVMEKNVVFFFIFICGRFVHFWNGHFDWQCRKWIDTIFMFTLKLLK